jgi:8-oxo-dGTP pyrophosphatase MutT (NUDIX family)
MSDYVRGLRSLVGHALLEVPTVSVAVLDDAGRLLLVRHVEGDDWTTPGGMVEPFETPADAAVRETWEETGLTVELTHVAGVFGGPLQQATYANGDRIAWVSTLFGARVLGGTPRPDEEETLECRFVTREEAARLRLKPHMPAVLAAAWRADARARYDAPTWRPPG